MKLLLLIFSFMTILKSNKITINAGEDQILYIPLVSVILQGRIDGNNTDNRLKCKWELISSPATSADAHIVCEDWIITSVVFNQNYLAGQKFVFKLSVTDVDGKVYYDTVTITIAKAKKAF